MSSQKIITFLWFKNEAEDAAKFYTSVFSNAPGGKNSRLGKILRVDEQTAKAIGQKPGTVLTAEFELFGQQFVALNGNPAFNFSESVSLQIQCETQQEIDYFWDKLITDGGAESQCGWLKDKFGFSWQVTPTILGKLISDPKKSQRVMAAMMPMKKLEIDKLEEAAELVDSH
jgi:predicted 3-demethylubiquinone-9 3-methyltransferase (glyoxalase superfamily)